MKAIRVLLALTVLAAVAPAQQPPDSVARPTYERGKGPVIAFDDAHKTTHPYSGGSRGLVRLLEADGYSVRALTGSISDRLLRGVDVLIVANPGGWEGPDSSLDEGEVSALLDWIRRGGSLLLVLDHMPAPRNAAALTAALGVTAWHNGYAMVEIPDSLPAGNIIFWRPDSLRPEMPAVTRTGDNRLAYQGADARLVKHSITEGRGQDERVQRVTTFVGSAFQAPEGAEALLILPRATISLMPTAPAPDVRTVGAPTAPVGDWLQGAVLTIGAGRVALFGEIGMFSGGPAPDNRKFVLNVIRWLTGLL